MFENGLAKKLKSCADDRSGEGISINAWAAHKLDCLIAAANELAKAEGPKDIKEKMLALKHCLCLL